MGRCWGEQLRHRYRADQGGMPCVIGRIMDEGEGASIRIMSQRVPESLLGVALEFHVAWQHCDYRDRRIAVIHYYLLKPIKVKATMVNVGVHSYYKQLDRTHRHMAALLDKGSYVPAHAEASQV